MAVRRLEMVIRGRVQGVGFRFFTEAVAREMGLVGYVRNTRHGAVEVVAEGDEEALERFRARLMQGPPLAHVSGADVHMSEATGRYQDFRIRV